MPSSDSNFSIPSYLMPERELPQRWVPLWTCFVLLAPLAFAVGFGLPLWKAHEAASRLDLRTDPAVFISAAQEFAKRFPGGDALGPAQFSTDEASTTFELLQASRDPLATKVLRELSPNRVTVKLAVSKTEKPKPGSSQKAKSETNTTVNFGAAATMNVSRSESKKNFEVEFAPDARVVGWKTPGVVSPLGSKIQAAVAADRVLGTGPLAAYRQYFGKATESDLDGDGQKFGWKASLPSQPKTELTVSSVFQNGLETSRDVNVHADKPSGFLRTVAKVAQGIYIFVFIIVLIGLAIRGMLQQEFSYLRALGVGLFLGVLFAAGVLAQTPDVGGDGDVPAWVIYLIIATSLSLCGVALGVGYAVLEEMVRVRLPEKLVSLDALLARKLTSANVSRSLLIGLAGSAWILLAHSLLVVTGTRMAGLTVEAASHWLIGAEFVWPVTTGMMSAVGFVLVGTVPPLLLHLWRPLSHRWAWIYLVAGAASVVLANTYLGREPVAAWEMPVEAVLAVFGLVAVFIMQDMLAACLAAAVLGVATHASAVLALSPSAVPLAVLTGALVLGTLMLVRNSKSGRVYRMNEVQPRYAANISERLAMQAELNTAREAQLKLLVTELPGLPGLSVAAACIPSREVTGDFYEVLPLDGWRMAVLLVGGRGAELAAALTIAFAKGYLMERCTAKLTVAQMADELADELAVRVAGEVPDFCYAVVDLRRGELEFARRGASMQVIVSPVGFGTESADGRVALSPGARILLSSGGLARLVKGRRKEVLGDWFRRVAGPPRMEAAQELQDRLLRTVLPQSLRRGKRKLEQDLAVVVMRIEQPDERALETVA